MPQYCTGSNSKAVYNTIILNFQMVSKIATVTGANIRPRSMPNADQYT